LKLVVFQVRAVSPGGVKEERLMMIDVPVPAKKFE